MTPLFPVHTGLVLQAARSGGHPSDRAATSGGHPFDGSNQQSSVSVLAQAKRVSTSKQPHGTCLSLMVKSIPTPLSRSHCKHTSRTLKRLAISCDSFLRDKLGEGPSQAYSHLSDKYPFDLDQTRNLLLDIIFDNEFSTINRTSRNSAGPDGPK